MYHVSTLLNKQTGESFLINTLLPLDVLIQPERVAIVMTNKDLSTSAAFPVCCCGNKLLFTCALMLQTLVQVTPRPPGQRALVKPELVTSGHV